MKLPDPLTEYITPITPKTRSIRYASDEFKWWFILFTELLTKYTDVNPESDF